MSLLRTLILVTALSATTALAMLPSEMRQTSVVEPAVARAHTADEIKRLPGGGEIHLLGIFFAQTNAWNMEGAPAKPLGFSYGGPGLSWQENKQMQRRFALRPVHLNRDDRFTVDFSNDVRNDCLTDTGPDQQINVSAIFPKDLRTTTLRVGVARGHWKTIASEPISSHLIAHWDGEYVRCKLWSSFHTLADGNEQASWTFVNGSNKAQLSARFNMINNDYRIVAIDSHGKTMEGLIDRMPPYSYPFQDWMAFETPKAKFRKVCIQTRPYEWVEFRDVPLYPASHPQAKPGSTPQ